MAFDLDSVPVSSRASYIKTGRDFGTGDTIAQANITLDGHARFGAAIAAYGFGPTQAEQLADLRDLARAVLATRSGTVMTNKQTRIDARDALKKGKAARAQARVVLEAAHADASDAPEGQTEPLRATLGEVAQALGFTRSSGDDKQRLAQQLGSLKAALERPGLAPFTAAIGGPEALAALDAALAGLSPVLDLPPGTAGSPADTERLDLVDGLIVALCRRARRAARLAAQARAEPSLAKAFELDGLYPKRRSPSTSSDIPPVEAAPTPIEPVA